MYKSHTQAKTVCLQPCLCLNREKDGAVLPICWAQGPDPAPSLAATRGSWSLGKAGLGLWGRLGAHVRNTPHTQLVCPVYSLGLTWPAHMQEPLCVLHPWVAGGHSA